MAKKKTRQLDLRFAVGAPDGLRSGIWRCVGYKSDVYLAPRELMFAVKVSLHRDRTCLYKVTGEHRERMASWGLEPTALSVAKWARPASSTTNPISALLVTFPFEGLASSPMKEDPARIVWLAPPRKGEAVKVAFMFVRGVDREKAVSLGPPAETLAYCHLDNGETVIIAAHTMEIDLEPHFGWYKQPRSARMNFLTPNTPPQEGGIVRSVFHGAAPDVGTFELFDIAIRIEPTVEAEKSKDHRA